MTDSVNLRKNLNYRHDFENVSWHKLSDELGINVWYLYEFAKHGKEPTNPEIRKRLGLKAKCPVCHRAVRLNPPGVKVKRTNWRKMAEDLYQECRRLIIALDESCPDPTIVNTPVMEKYLETKNAQKNK